MKIRLRETITLMLLLASLSWSQAQITAPVIRGKFGVDADVQLDWFNEALKTSPVNDDWYYRLGSAANTGIFIIDTAGAGAKMAQYAAGKNLTTPFYKKMQYPAFSIVGSRTLIDAIFVRDYHGNDTTAFAAGSDKNGDSPADWTGDVQSIPNKNDILDSYVHIRREGPTGTLADTLWMYGGLALEATNGNRYFDFELYQTDIFYTRATKAFTGYGPDAGHTSWKFDAAGNVTQVGDIIFSANYGSSSLSSIEARIWIDEADFAIIPNAFDWTYTFDGANSGSQYGYAGIKPKTADPFYFGTTNSTTSWAGPYGIVRADNSVLTSFAAGQFMEFGVNLSILGLNPDKLLGVTNCGIPFSKILIKTRSSVSFNAELKDFIGPFDLFLPDKADAAADQPVFCGATGISTLTVVNPYSTSNYAWTTANGHIVGATTGTSITVDQPGTYIVTQTLATSCPYYASDTVVITSDPTCVVLATNDVTLSGELAKSVVNLDWSVFQNQEVQSFTIERSIDGTHFTLVDIVNNQSPTTRYLAYKATDNVSGLNGSYVYYRIKVSGRNGGVQYTRTIRVALDGNSTGITLSPNPVRDHFQLYMHSDADRDVQVQVYSVTGQLMRTMHTQVKKGYSTISMDDFKSWAKGMYTVKVLAGSDTFIEKMILTK
ncbi:hypothetical protein A3860_04035 [Niastella vici]|uniref:Secretion system C-terminal sorting domain-containing protein n=1 Tax=Niastella vici TaxID=1703345 RepID=A0A1V9FRJ1_9BACT|nr:T9SS type A sorting domain-containing protein [Niastella vici]OQP60907.1 hypothetical protein A3860_04035 [Niastella vici]